MNFVVSSVRSSNSHSDLLVIQQHPTFSNHFSELTPRAPIPDGRMERIMQPCSKVRIVHCFCLLAGELMLDKTRGTSREGVAVSLMTTSGPLICLKPTIIENLSRGIKTLMFIKGIMCTFRPELS